ncbi:MAG: hypothetical protein KAX20_04620 [Candidatus Omnitrophica bacterium]|nr:hypothetical protein [Candidatus Omnitrophota bacterium]
MAKFTLPKVVVVKLALLNESSKLDHYKVHIGNNKKKHKKGVRSYVVNQT